MKETKKVGGINDTNIELFGHPAFMVWHDAKWEWLEKKAYIAHNGLSTGEYLFLHHRAGTHFDKITETDCIAATHLEAEEYDSVSSITARKWSSIFMARDTPFTSLYVLTVPSIFSSVETETKL
eukprot:9943854-Ditylum_brightwellii.AAC.1